MTHLFLHLPKTGGTTINRGYLPTAFSSDEYFLLRGRPEANRTDLELLYSMRSDELNAYTVIVGHNTFGLVDRLEDVVTLSVIRDPVTQVKSTYFHVLYNDAESPQAQQIRNDGTTLARFGRNAWNPQFRGIGGRQGEDAATALDRVDFVGVTDQLEKFLFTLHLHLGWPLVVFDNRLVSQVSRRYRMSGPERRAIERGNPIDVALYRQATERFRDVTVEVMGPAEERLWRSYVADVEAFRSRELRRPDENHIWHPPSTFVRSSPAYSPPPSDAPPGPTAVTPATVPTDRPPVVTFVTTCYNSIDFIQKCVDSVLGQDYPHVEHIVQDAASDDGTTQLLEGYGDAIDLVSEPDSGESDGLNRALARVTGDIFLVLNADDAVFSHAARWAVEQFWKHPDAGAVYGDQFLIDINDEVIGLNNGPDPFDYMGLVCGEVVPPAQASFLSTSAMRSVGMWTDPGLKHCPDHEMWVRMGAEFPCFHEPGLVTKYRWHATGKGRQSKVVDEMVESKWLVSEPALDKYAAQIPDLRRRARSSLDLWGAAMCLDAGDPVRAGRYLARGLLRDPSSDRIEILAEKLGHWRFRRMRQRYLAEWESKA